MSESTYSSDTYSADTYATDEAPTVQNLPSRASIPFIFTPPEQRDLELPLEFMQTVTVVAQRQHTAVTTASVLKPGLVEQTFEIEIKVPVLINGATVWVKDSVLDAISVRELLDIVDVARVAHFAKVAKIVNDFLKKHAGGKS